MSDSGVGVYGYSGTFGGTGTSTGVYEAGDQDSVASLLVTSGALLEEHGQPTASKSRYEDALAIYRKLGDEGGAASALNNLAIVYRDLGDYAAAKKAYAGSIAVSRAVGDKEDLGL